jgi:hypothetical protein
MRTRKQPAGRSILFNLEFQLMIIVSVLMLVGTQIFVWYHADGKLKGCNASGTEIKKALALYAGDNSGEFPDSLQRLVPSYIDKIPVCPVRRRDTYSPSYSCSDNHRRCTFYCSGRNHQLSGLEDNLPVFHLP